MPQTRQDPNRWDDRRDPAVWLCSADPLLAKARSTTTRSRRRRLRLADLDVVTTPETAATTTATGNALTGSVVAGDLAVTFDADAASATLGAETVVNVSRPTPDRPAP